MINVGTIHFFVNNVLKVTYTVLVLTCIKYQFQFNKGFLQTVMYAIAPTVGQALLELQSALISL
jgi:hypothetical protein